ncbi:large ribosomal subunit protein mL51-like isoform X2 [Oratosquilla oratoria]|uniref:large ribosomal subunit protein mL51-like isoform X2 n=1 Tax=Oratosquilla oratoria TaxID=337810 RepID=UPI003F76D57B
MVGLTPPLPPPLRLPLPAPPSFASTASKTVFIMSSIVGKLLTATRAVVHSPRQLFPYSFHGSWMRMDFGSEFLNLLKQNTSTPSVTSVRHRYHADKIASGPLLRNYGLKDKLHNKGLLPRLEGTKRLPMPLYKPANAWSEKKALFGQNDYIDILGNGNLHPTEVCYSVPSWLRGFKGSEYRMLLRKRKMFQAQMKHSRPTKMKDLNKRIKYLYKFLNRKTKTYYAKNA